MLDRLAFGFIIIFQPMIYVLCSWVLYGLKAIFVCLHITLSRYGHYAKSCRFIWKHWTCRMLVRCILSGVSNSPLSHLPFMQYMRCILAYPSSWRCENIWSSSYCHNQIGNINYRSHVGISYWSNGMRCTSDYLLITWKVQFSNYSCSYF